MDLIRPTAPGASAAASGSLRSESNESKISVFKQLYDPFFYHQIIESEFIPLKNKPSISLSRAEDVSEMVDRVVTNEVLVIITLTETDKTRNTSHFIVHYINKRNHCN